MAGKDLQSVRIQATLIGQINVACHQNDVAILRELTLENLNPNMDLADITLTLEAEPGFLTPRSWTIEQLDAGESITIDDCQLELKEGFLAGLVDETPATINFQVTYNELLLAETGFYVNLLACHQWGGVEAIPELLASYCIPGGETIQYLLDYAGEILRQAPILRQEDAPDIIDGYQSRSRERVWLMAAALYSSISALQLQAAETPTDFLQNGQKVCLPGLLQRDTRLTSLDGSLLMAAVLERAGLNPLLILTKNQAWVGVWLQAESFATAVIDEGEMLRQRIPLKELIVIDAMGVTAPASVPFAEAVTHGEQAVALGNESEFVCVIDICRARQMGIKPLALSPLPLGDVKGITITDGALPTLAPAPTFPVVFDHNLDSADCLTPHGRLDRWQRRLLDLSARNSLLNFKPRKSSLSFVGIDAAELEDVLSSGAKISILPLGDDGSNAADRSAITDFAAHALLKNQLLVDLPAEELEKRTVTIYRQAQRSLKESGSNTLFLALGFLLWKPQDKSDRRYRAPLILLPVEMERKTVRSGIKLIAGDEEPSFNTTLLELLKQDFGIELDFLQGKLATDEHGVDVVTVWNQVRQAIKSMPGFEVVEELVLGHFSFAKYLMWKDMVDRSGALQKSPVVQHLLETPRQAYGSDIHFVNADELDRNFTPADLLTPLSADSSQMAAIASADRGKDFILIGPPGTGKSQTISNLIAHMLGQGKKVLFVSEKTAALEVVYRRLKDIGLGQFCLQLHSNKARKIDVINQLRTSWNSGFGAGVYNWEAEVNRLKRLRDRLNDVVESLHRQRRNGLSVHTAMGIKVRDESWAAKVVLSWPSADYHDEAQLQELRAIVERLGIQARAIKNLTHHPLRVVHQIEWQPQWQSEVVAQCQQLEQASLDLTRALKSFQTATGIELGVVGLVNFPWVAELAQVLLASYHTPIAFAFSEHGLDRLMNLEQAAEHLQVFQGAKEKLNCEFDSLAWKKLNINSLELQWQRANQTWWPKRLFASRKVVKQLCELVLHGQPQPDTDIPALQAMQVAGNQIERLDRTLRGVNGWQAFESDPATITAIASVARRGRAVLGKLATSGESLSHLYTQVEELLNDSRDLLTVDAGIGRVIADFLSTYQKFQHQRQHLENLVQNNLESVVDGQQPLQESITEICRGIVEHQHLLKDWCYWMRRKSEALSHQLEPLVTAVEQGQVTPQELSKVFEAAYCSWWSSAVIGEDEVLRTFSSAEHNAAIDQFRQLDTDFSQLTTKYIGTGLTSQIPDQKDIKRKSSWGILQHELQKKARHKPVREMMEEIPEVITTLTPCLMMSPLSIAQYLPPEQTLFDLVIFDEASQMTVWDAVGALARGRQVVMAGDPKQMPPTNFFARSDEDPDGEVDDEEDLESILDELIGASIPQRVLNLHYRSRRESLIDFSNRRYYNHALTTFPAPVHPDRGVSLVRTSGYYARGKARNNEGEAKAIVAEILQRLTSEDSSVRSKSLGVVTFNAEQQGLIEDLLDQARIDDPSIEWAFSEESTPEPLFVKNLETVQGDERDVILFSITYGPDESGKVSMNFGPLNRLGGERRLNVALTRARFEMLVFSTLSPDSMDLTRTQSRAVIDLKHFLEYAARGTGPSSRKIHESTQDMLSPFEQAVAQALRDKGWEIHPNVGVSAYRIDLGVVHPDQPGRYLAGIECDGAMYVSVAFARERDKIRQSVMQGLGWTLYRAWSIDWWVNPSKAVEDLHHALTQQLQAGSKS